MTILNLKTLDFQPEFLSQVNHELRIPLTGIMGMVHFLKRTTLTLEQEQYLQVISMSGERLLSLTKSLDSMISKELKKK